MEERYLAIASETLVLDHGRTLDDCRTAELDKLAILHLSKRLLKAVEVLASCSALRSCTLANNYLTDITALRHCVHIVQLDLHGNQIQNLPGQEFWRPLKNLKLLYLHNNRIRGVHNVESLSSSPNLTGLTLYDTPLSLQKTYRHLVVNSIWSLKALDNFVVSDEEIIEDWTLRGKFKALSPDLHINMLLVFNKDISPENQMKAANEIIRKINGVLATTSPVLIVQKWIRGHLVRRRMGLIPPLQMKRMKLHYRRGGSQEERTSPRDNVGVRQDFWALPLNRRRPPVTKQGKNGNKPVRRVNSSADLQPAVRITADLRKLQRDVLQALPEAEIVYDLGNQNQRLPSPPISEGLQEERRAKGIKLTASKHTDQDHPEPDQDNNTELGLFGRKAVVYESEPSKDIMITNEKSAEEIRSSIHQIHAAMQAKGEANLIKDQPHLRPARSGRHLIKLLPLCAVDKAYENREKYDSQMKKRNLVVKIQACRKQAKYNIQEFLENKVKEAVDQDAKDSLILERQAEGKTLDNSNFIDKVKYRHKQFCKQKEAKRSDYLLTKEFNFHHLSVAKTMLRHHRMIQRQEEMQEKNRLVQTLKEDHDRQKEFTKCLQDHRQLLLQIENASEKVTLGSLVLQKANDRLHEARAHVTTMKGQHISAEPMSKVPVKQTVSKGTPLKHGRT